MRPKIGHIQYLNCLPLYYGLINNKALFDIELIKAIPTELNRLLLNNELEVSPISSIEYCRNADKLLLLPELTVSSDGKVKSILLISKIPIEKLNGKKVALTTSSATSRVLTQIILKEKYNIDVQYTNNKENLKETLKDADAALLIGDDALKILYKPEDLLIYDLGQEWKELTGEKMVYAVWAVQSEFAYKNPQILQEIFTAFILSKNYSSTRLWEIANASARWEKFDVQFLYNYFKTLRFEFGEDYQKGLKTFFTYAKKYNAVEKISELQFADLKETKETIQNDDSSFMNFLPGFPPIPIEIHNKVFSHVFKGIKDFMQMAHNERKI